MALKLKVISRLSIITQPPLISVWLIASLRPFLRAVRKRKPDDEEEEEPDEEEEKPPKGRGGSKPKAKAKAKTKATKKKWVLPWPI